MLRLDGKKVAEYRKAIIREKVEKMRRGQGRVPGLAVILVGEDPASQVYVGNKEKACQAVGMNSWVHRLPASVREEDLKALIEQINQTPEANGLLVQLPLPQHLNSDKVLVWIDPRK